MSNQIIQGNVLNILPTLLTESINCVVTSPPYWGLRDYGIEPVIWDGDKDCGHEWATEVTKRPNSSGGQNSNKLKIKGEDNFQEFVDYHKRETTSDFCLKCGAWRGSLGLEPTFELYIKHLCDIFDEVKRVLRKDGTCFVNIGDTYNNNPSNSGKSNLGNAKALEQVGRMKREQNNVPVKSLCDIPYRFSIKMVNRGWIKRNTIIWHKPNCMPSSAKDRFTVDFEYVYFFVKGKNYWFEQQFEDNVTLEHRPNYTNIIGNKNTNKFSAGTKGFRQREGDTGYINPQGRNKRAVWTIPTKSFKEAHFAVYPETLIDPMIQAGCPRYVCKKCGKARVKIYEYIYKGSTKSGYNDGHGQGKHLMIDAETKHGKLLGLSDCGCNVGFEGGVVLDPFIGAGTTAVVAKKQGKRYLGIEIKQEYIDMANKRIKAIPELLPF